jgi:hypothetical protein
VPVAPTECLINHVFPRDCFNECLIINTDPKDWIEKSPPCEANPNGDLDKSGQSTTLTQTSSKFFFSPSSRTTIVKTFEASRSALTAFPTPRLSYKLYDYKTCLMKWSCILHYIFTYFVHIFKEKINRTENGYCINKHFLNVLLVTNLTRFSQSYDLNSQYFS